MSRSYVVQPLALSDLHAILQRIASDNPNAAVRVGREFYVAAEHLARFPYAGHRNRQLSPRYRFWRVESYAIAYRPETNPLEIARVLSYSQNIESLLEDDDELGAAA